MLDYLYAAGQALCLIGLAWGAWLALASSETLRALREASARHRSRSGRHRTADVDDPHASSLGYWF
jgi:hypothetical protein